LNANELAELIGHLENAKYVGASKAATMLRQQQEKLTKYELRHVAQRDRIAILEMQHKQQQAEIEVLKKENRYLLGLPIINELLKQAFRGDVGGVDLLRKAQEK